MRNISKRNGGFTIIEVLIVLAIAALIMLIVFLAVPSLQRNSRNSGRTNDISRIGAAVNDWVSNNNGAVFVAGAGNANLTSVLNSVGASSLSQYVPTAGTTFTVATGARAALASTSPDNIVVVTGAQCGTGGATVAGSARQMALQWQKEGGSGPIPVCTDI